MEIAKLVLEYLKIFLAPQIIAGIVVLFFLIAYKNDIKELMRRIAKIRLPGGSELSTSQHDKMSDDITKEDINKIKPPEQISVPKSLSLTPDQQKIIRETFQATQQLAILWEYRFLNLYLVYNTQSVLDWLASLPQRTTLSMYYSIWMPIVSSADERRAIIDALQRHNLIAIKEGLIEVTSKGVDYIQWRGPINK